MAKNKKILIAEDEKPMAMALQLKIKSSGMEADITSNGEEALNKLQKGKYDLVLLDLMMPKVDGFGVLEELKKRKDKTAVIVTSNLSQPEDVKRTMELGAKGYLVKSDTPIAEIIKKIEQTLK